MKTKLASLGTLLLFCLFAIGAQATVILNENFSYPNGTLTNVTANWRTINGSGMLPVQDNLGIITFTNVAAGTSGDDIAEPLGATYTSGVLYMCAMVSISNATTTASGDYFLSFYSTNSSGGGYAVRIFQSGATGGGWTFAMTNAGGSKGTQWTSALTTATWYKLITRYDCAAKTTTFGVFPASYVPSSDSELTVSANPSTTSAGVNAVAIRQGGNSSPFSGAIDYIVVADSLADVAGAHTVSPAVATQPQDASAFTGSSVSFSNFSLGDAPLTYQWYYNTNTLLTEAPLHFIGTTTSMLVVTKIVLGDAGTYSCVVSNAVGTNVTRYALLSVSPQPIPPIIDSDIAPIGSTNLVGDSVSFSVTAHGLPAVAYQWKWIPDTNTLVTNIIAGANSASLPLSIVTTNQSGKYFVTITNSAVYQTTNSAQAVLKVNPSPFLTIAQLRAMVDGNYNPTNTTAYYTIQGTVTTWTNMTTSAAPQFFMQDSTAGIMVYWANAGGSNCPPAGAVVRVTGPLSPYQGNLEINPNYQQLRHWPGWWCANHQHRWSAAGGTAFAV